MENKELIIESLRKRARLFSLMGYVSLILIAGLFVLASTIYIKSEGIATQTQVNNLNDQISQMSQAKKNDSLGLTGRIEELRQKYARDSVRYYSRDNSGVISENLQLRDQLNRLNLNYGTESQKLKDSCRVVSTRSFELENIYFEMEEFARNQLTAQSQSSRQLNKLSQLAGDILTLNLNIVITEFRVQHRSDSIDFNRLRNIHKRSLLFR